MKSCTANWLTRAFRGLLDDSNCGSRSGGMRFAPPRLESLESRNLLSNASGVWSFASAPQLRPMKVNVLAVEPGASLDPIFVAPYDQSPDPSYLVGQTGVLMMDASGNPVWFHPTSSNNSLLAFGFQRQTLFGKPVLTWWQGTVAGIKPSQLPPGTPLGGEYVIYNQHYQKIMAVKAPRGFAMDEHEFTITPQGDAYFFGLKSVNANLTPYGGPANGSYEDPEILEVNLRTGRLIWAWNMAAHVPLSDAMVPVPTTPGQPWDPYHANSIDVSADGSQILLSARNTWGIYDISRSTGQILWELGGKQNEFSLPSSLITGPYGSAFQFQHDARFVAGGISLFDDGAVAPPPAGGLYGPARGLILNVDVHTLTATPAGVYYHNPALYANSQGNVQELANGDVLVGWGSDSLNNGQLNSYYTEYSPSGSVLADFVLAGEDISYRAFSQPWVGTPLAKPAAAVAEANGHTTVYASWNGSTQTVAWKLLAGRTPASLKLVSITPRTGFETAIATTAPGPFYEVKALGPHGKALKTSAILRAPGKVR
jgi:hypothetical protein